MNELQGTTERLIPWGPLPPPHALGNMVAERDHPCLACKTDNGEIASFLLALPFHCGFHAGGNLIPVTSATPANPFVAL